jgi:restriction system protein
MLPKQREVEIPLLQVIVALGGQGRAGEIYPLVTKKFPQVREEDLLETLPSGSNKWTNRIQWARQTLVAKGELDSPGHGIWRITEKGRQRLKGAAAPQELAPTATFTEIYEEYETSFRTRLLDKLQSLSPTEFEQFAQRLLKTYGFVDVRVTQRSRDGGIDGYGKLRLGLATMNVAFQCKKWQGNVGRPEVDKFRGAIHGEFEQGVFFTTSDFTPDARDASLKRGAVPIILLNGDSIVNLMIEKGLGVERIPLYLYYERPRDFAEREED